MAKIVIADTSCLISLYNANILDLLEKLFSEVIITSIIKEEFGQPLPKWIKIKNPESNLHVENLCLTLDRGEASAIALAMENGNYKIIIDEKKGRNLASSLGIQTTGTIAILISASEKGYLKNLMATIDVLMLNDFRLSKRLYKEISLKYESK